MRAGVLLLLAAGSLGFGCASLPTLTERPEEYQLYRAARVAATQEERLRAADRYLREVPRGPHVKQLRGWFEKAEEKYYLGSFDQLSRLYAYEAALPRGPHIAEVRSRIVALETRRTAKQDRATQEDGRFAATAARLAQADAGRRAFVASFKDWVSRLSKIKTFGEPTSELDDGTIFAFRMSEPRGACQGDTCRKLQQLSYEVPGERELVDRVALLEVQLELERGMLRKARLTGPELWTRLAEALALEPIENPSAEQRAAAVNRATLLVRAVLEPALPAAQCEVEVELPVVLERACRGLRVRMLAGQSRAEDDAIEFAPALAGP